MKRRAYHSYQEYLDHQKRKTLNVKAGKCTELGPFERRVARFRALLEPLRQYFSHGRKVLCLGARRGEEVQAFRNMGCDAIGVDLVAFEPLVIQADFHKLPFGAGTFDCAFSNSLDHAYDYSKLADEVWRILKDDAAAIFHLSIGHWSDEMAIGLDAPGEFLDHFRRFMVVRAQPIAPYGGGINYLVVLRKDSASKSPPYQQ